MVLVGLIVTVRVAVDAETGSPGPNVTEMLHINTLDNMRYFPPERIVSSARMDYVRLCKVHRAECRRLQSFCCPPSESTGTHRCGFD